jgi:hypothetical protein
MKLSPLNVDKDMTAKENNSKTSYSTPGPDDSFLRPTLGHSWAPREIALEFSGGSVWMSWVHRTKGSDAIVTTRYKAGKSAPLTVVDAKGLYSKPAWLQFPGNRNTLLYFGRMENNDRFTLKGYTLQNGRWQPVESLPTRCRAIYHMDTVAVRDDEAYLAYCGVEEQQSGIKFFYRRFQSGRWGEESHFPAYDQQVNRPKLIVDGNDEVYVIADAYRNGKYHVVFKRLSSGPSKQRWIRLSNGEGWNMFPAVAIDANGRIIISWLYQSQVIRNGVLGSTQTARMVRMQNGKWETLTQNGSMDLADLNLGLLPINRYFGYDGLRRYPRPLAIADGSVWVIWEQQKDEEEIWDNLSNGFLLGKKLDNGKWSGTKILHDRGACHTFDTRQIYTKSCFPVAVKMEHHRSGNDFIVVDIDLTKEKPYHGKPESLWGKWTSISLPKELRKNNRLKVSVDDRVLTTYWGDLHCHSYFSPDAEGEPDELYYFARDLAKIDFVCVADNDFYPSKILLNSEIHYTAELAKSLTAENQFIALAGYEWTYYRDDPSRTNNHRIIVFPCDSPLEAVRRNESNGASEKAFKAYLDKNGYFAFPHHAYWRFLNSPYEWGVEVTAAWGTYILDCDTVFKNLDKGKRFAFLGNSDTHRFMPGLSGALTGVFATELTKKSLFDAVRNRRTFATTGNKTVVTFWLNDTFMGGESKSYNPPKLRWRIIPHGKLERIDLIRDGKTIHSSNRKSGEWRDVTVKEGQHWYILQVKEEGKHQRHPHNVAMAWGKYAWSSPIWLNFE